MTATATMTAAADTAKKQPKGLKKVLKYFQDQATANSSSGAVIYLTPSSPEPQHKVQYRRHVQQHSRDLSRTFSNATTAVEVRHRRRQQQQHRDTEPTMRDSNAGASRTSSSVLTQSLRKIQYANENLLQSYELYEPEIVSHDAKQHGLWVLFVHGGYFCDPKVDASSFRPALALLTGTSSSIAEESESGSTNSEEPSDFSEAQQHIAGYASINYRLSPSKDYPQDPETTLNYERRNARWPDQLDDIVAAVKRLQSRHGFGSKYILSGHSVGATLAFLTALHAAEKGIDPPACVIGLNGIYDFADIHRTNPDYEAMTKAAMTPEQYREASPALYPVKEYTRASQAGTTRFLLSHSRDDGLVVWDQLKSMSKVLAVAQDDENNGKKKFDLEVVETHGQHDEIWQQGRELARVIQRGVSMVVR